MSDLAATNCGNGCGTGLSGGCDSCSIIWIILLLSCFCGNGTSLLGNNGDGCGCGNNSCLLIILLLLFCGGNGLGLNNNGCGCNNFGCGC